MTETIHLSDCWEHTITKILKHDPKYKVGDMIREWVIFNKLEDFNSLLHYTDDDFTPTGNLRYTNDNGEKLHHTPMQELYNLRWYIQHLIDESGYGYDDDQFHNPLSEDNWMLQTHWKFIKYVVFPLQEMTPEQLKMNPIRPIIKVNPNQEIDKDYGESNKDEEESATSTELSEENSTSEYILKLQKSQNKLKHLKFIMFLSNQHMMKMIHLKTNL